MFGNRSNGGGKVCQFYLEGRCKFGPSCKNLHPSDQSSSSNRFAPLQNGSSNNAGGRGRSGALGGADRFRPEDNKAPPPPFHLSAEGIRLDLTSSTERHGERPLWPLSCYGPGKDAPRQLLEGIIEQSFEEVRLQFYVARAGGNEQSYLQTEKAASDQADQQVQSILNDLEGAVKYVIDGEHQQSNRLDQIVKPSAPWVKRYSTKFANTPPASGFGAPSASGSTFGQPSTFGTSKPSAFGQPSSTAQNAAFGQPSTPGSGSAFGQVSSLGKPAFGQASAPASNGSEFRPLPALGGGSSSNTTFRQPSSFGGQQPAFGQASRPAFGQPAFGHPSQPAFGQTSKPAFGAPSQPAFGAPSQPASGFGQASALGSGSQMSTTFGQPSQPKASPFAAAASQPSPFAQAGSKASPQPSAAFGQPSNTGGPQQQKSTFGQPSPFAQQQPQQQAQQQAQQPNGTFGQPSTAQPASNSPFAAKLTSSPAFGQSSQPTTNTFGQPTKTQATLLAKSDQPNGPTAGAQPNGVATINRDMEGPAEKYTGELGALLQEVYQYVNQTGQFKDGIMPEIPPKREWIIPA